MSAPSQASLGDAQFVLLTTFRKDGTGVPTAVWVVPLADGLGVWTPDSSGKVKRIRRDGAVTVAACTRTGEPLGPAVPGRATLLDAAGTAEVRRGLRRKYGLVGKALTTLNGLRKSYGTPVGVAITLDPGP